MRALRVNARADTEIRSKALPFVCGSRKLSRVGPVQTLGVQGGVSEAKIDQLLVERVQKGEKHAFDLLIQKYQHRIVSLVSRYVSDHAEAQDVAQEAFIKAYRALPNFRGDSAFYTWIYRIAVNTAKNHLVAKGRRPPASDIDADEADFYDDEMRKLVPLAPLNFLQGNVSCLRSFHEEYNFF